jgi:YidC/Oxa1 family membrane protein insertase
MDFGVSFLSNNVMLPILDFFYGIVPSYGLAIVALTLVVRFALYPLSAGSIRSMRRMKVAQPVMQQRVKVVQEQYKDDPAKQQEEMGKLYKEFGNPLAGCLPLVVQMPVLFALFATLRGSPFSNVPYTLNLQILPQEQMVQVQPQAFATPPHNIYLADGVHAPVVALLPSGDHIGVGDKTKVDFQSVDGKPLSTLLQEYPDTRSKLQPKWEVSKGQERVKVSADGTIEALQPGDVTLQASIPGLAADTGFLFIDALGRVGAFDPDGTIHWDIVAMVLFFGISLYVSQILSGQGQTANANSQQDAVNKITPIIFSGMFLVFPLPAGVLMYMVVANIFQTLQTYILSREPLPENLQKIVDEQEKKKASTVEAQPLPFEPKRAKTESSTQRKVEPKKAQATKPQSKLDAKGSKSNESSSSKKKA